MNKTTFAALLLSLLTTGLSAQQYTTGDLPLFTGVGGELAVKVDVTSALVTVTLTGNATRWMGLGFGQTGMNSGGDVIMFDGTTLSDRQHGGIGVTPTMDAQQDWTLLSNNISGSMRTIVATRAPNTGEAGDFVFNAAEAPITFMFARGQDLTIAYHGGGNCGGVTTNLTLANDKFTLSNTQIYPNPSFGEFLIQAPIALSKVTIYSQTGALVKDFEMDSDTTELNVSGLQSGVYMIELSHDAQTSWKKVIVK